MKKLLMLAVATLVLGCTEEVTQWTPELDLDAPNAQLAESPDLAEELAALQAQIAALEAALKEAGDSDVALKEELAKLKEELAKLSGEDEKNLLEIDLSKIKTLVGSQVVAGYGIWIKEKETSTALAFQPGEHVLSQGTLTIPMKVFEDTYKSSTTCLMLCPTGTAPYARTLATKEYTFVDQVGAESKKSVTYPVWHCGTMTVDTVAHDDAQGIGKIICGGVSMEMKDEISASTGIIADSNSTFAQQRAFFEPGAKPAFEKASCPNTVGISGVIAASSFYLNLMDPTKSKYGMPGIANLQCGVDKSLQPVSSNPVQSSTYYPLIVLPSPTLFKQETEILHCNPGLDLVGWARMPQTALDGGGSAYMALCRAKKKSLL